MILHTVIAITLIAFLVCGLLFLADRHFVSAVRRRRHSAASGNKPASRKCRYCFFGRARLAEQTARVEADDLVHVRCWVCSSCGLPHWTVTRSPVLKPVNTRE
jgi:hypothetical protein